MTATNVITALIPSLYAQLWTQLCVICQPRTTHYYYKDSPLILSLHFLATSVQGINVKHWNNRK